MPIMGKLAVARAHANVEANPSNYKSSAKELRAIESAALDAVQIDIRLAFC